MKIGIIGAGLAGATAARHLNDAGHTVCVLEKSGGTGGRLSTRRSDVGLFDHGAQYLSAKGEAFQALLSEMEKAGAAARWSPQGQDRPQPWYRGTPGMSGLVKPLLADIEVRNRQTVNAVQLAEGGVLVSTQEGETYVFDRLVVCCPAPQARVLIGGLDSTFAALDDVVYAPCWTAMLAFEQTVQGAPDVLRGAHTQPLGWLTRESAKRGAGGYDCFTMQAGMVWSAEHLERDKDDIAAEMAAYFCDYFKTDVTCVSAVAHRWRYAAVTHCVGAPFLSGCDHHIVVAGDGLLGGRAEAAFDSGKAAAEFLCAQAA